MILKTAKAIAYAENFEKFAAEMFKEPIEPLNEDEEVVLYHIFTMFHRDPTFKAFMTEAAVAFSNAATNCNCPNCTEEKKDGT